MDGVIVGACRIRREVYDQKIAREVSGRRALDHEARLVVGIVNPAKRNDLVPRGAVSGCGQVAWSTRHVVLRGNTYDGITGTVRAVRRLDTIIIRRHRVRTRIGIAGGVFG